MHAAPTDAELQQGVDCHCCGAHTTPDQAAVDVGWAIWIQAVVLGVVIKREWVCPTCRPQTNREWCQ